MALSLVRTYVQDKRLICLKPTLNLFALRIGIWELSIMIVINTRHLVRNWSQGQQILLLLVLTSTNLQPTLPMLKLLITSRICESMSICKLKRVSWCSFNKSTMPENLWILLKMKHQRMKEIRWMIPRCIVSLSILKLLARSRNLEQLIKLLKASLIVPHLAQRLVISIPARSLKTVRLENGRTLSSKINRKLVFWESYLRRKSPKRNLFHKPEFWERPSRQTVSKQKMWGSFPKKISTEVQNY